MSKKLQIAQVCSKINDKNIRNNLSDSPIWDNCKHLDELTEEEKVSGEWYCYKVKFDGTIPVQVINTKLLK